MTNGDRIRRMGDSDLANYICNNLNPSKKCAMCTVGLDDKNRCRNPKMDCEEMIFNWLGEKEDKNVR